MLSLLEFSLGLSVLISLCARVRACVLIKYESAYRRYYIFYQHESLIGCLQGPLPQMLKCARTGEQCCFADLVIL